MHARCRFALAPLCAAIALRCHRSTPMPPSLYAASPYATHTAIALRRHRLRRLPRSCCRHRLRHRHRKLPQLHASAAHCRRRRRRKALLGPPAILAETLLVSPQESQRFEQTLRPRGAGSRARGLRRRCALAASSSWFWKTSSSSHFACWQECRGGPKSGQPRWGEGRWGSKVVLKTKEQSVTQPRYDAPLPPLPPRFGASSLARSVPWPRQEEWLCYGH
uniref:Putative secreted protein n=1 Tax=Ixodes ricinus TaxID=34613 RepID=A0A6B0V2R2_IXORI